MHVCLCMCVYVYVCLCVYVYVYLYVYACVCTYVCVCAHIYIYICICICKCICICIYYIYMYIYMHTHTYIHMRMWVHAYEMYNPIVCDWHKFPHSHHMYMWRLWPDDMYGLLWCKLITLCYFKCFSILKFMLSNALYLHTHAYSLSIVNSMIHPVLNNNMKQLMTHMSTLQFHHAWFRGVIVTRPTNDVHIVNWFVGMGCVQDVMVCSSNGVTCLWSLLYALANKNI